MHHHYKRPRCLIKRPTFDMDWKDGGLVRLLESGEHLTLDAADVVWDTVPAADAVYTFYLPIRSPDGSITLMETTRSPD